MVDNLGVLKRENAGIEKWENPPITPSSLSTVVIVKEKKDFQVTKLATRIKISS
jgi:hypothetical protein